MQKYTPALIHGLVKSLHNYTTMLCEYLQPFFSSFAHQGYWKWQIVFSDNHCIYSKCKRVHLILTGLCTELSPVLSGRRMQFFVSDHWEFRIPLRHRSTRSELKPLLGHPCSSFTMRKEGKKERKELWRKMGQVKKGCLIREQRKPWG